MSSSSEYTKPTSGGAGCAYQTLCSYNIGGQMAPMGNSKTVSGRYIVPSWDPISYDTLSHGGMGSCGSYFNIQNAYGKNAGKCNQSYVTSLCNSGCGKK